MSPCLQILLGLPGLALLCYGAEFLVRGGVRLSTALNIPKVVVGLTLVAFATSAPELVVSIDSALKGVGDISIGNVVGSNICNIGLILGTAALLTPMSVDASLLRFDMPLLLAATALLCIVCAATHGIRRMDAVLFLAGFAWYLWKNVQTALARKQGEAESPEEKAPPIGIPMALCLVAGGIAALAGGAKLFVDGAIALARLCRVSDAVIGLTVVAIGTSLPELATSTVAAFRGEKEIAVGNVVGSNIFNILAILGIAPLIAPMQAAGIQTADLGIMLGITILMYAMMLTGKVIRRAEGLALLLCHLAYGAWLFLHG